MKRISAIVLMVLLIVGSTLIGSVSVPVIGNAAPVPFSDDMGCYISDHSGCCDSDYGWPYCGTGATGYLNGPVGGDFVASVIEMDGWGPNAPFIVVGARVVVAPDECDMPIDVTFGSDGANAGNSRAYVRLETTYTNQLIALADITVDSSNEVVEATTSLNYNIIGVYCDSPYSIQVAVDNSGAVGQW